MKKRWPIILLGIAILLLVYAIDKYNKNSYSIDNNQSQTGSFTTASGSGLSGVKLPYSEGEK